MRGRLNPVERPEPLSKQAYLAIKQAIFNRAIVTDGKLTEVDLARRLGLSRTPVHEAVTRLATEGLVELDGSGVTILFSDRQVAEIYDLRHLLEGYAVRLAAEKMTHETLAELEAISSQADNVSLDDYETRARTNQDFHWLILTASDHRELIRMLDSLRQYYPSKELAGRYSPEHLAAAKKQHEEILAALKARDGARAEAAYHAHLDLAREEILKGDNNGVP